MSALTMRNAVAFLRARREDESGLAGSGERVSLGGLAAVSFAFAAGLAAVVGLLGAVAGPLVADWFPSWAAAPLASAARTFVLGLGLSVLSYPFLRFHEEPPRGQKSGFGLYLGEATGRLRDLGHRAGAARGERVVLGTDDACQNVAVSGGIGASKTTRVMYPLLLQLLDQDTGGLILDVKSTFQIAVGEAVNALHDASAARVELIGPGRTQMNLLKGLSPEMAASNIKSALLLTGKVSEDPIWINTAGDWCRSALGVLSYLPARYSLGSLYRYLFNEEYAAEVIAEAQVVRDRLPLQERDVLQSYLDYRNIVFGNFEPRFVAGVRATVSQILAPFTHPALIDAFCTEPLQGAGVDFRRILEGKVLVVDLPLQRWGIGAKVAYTFLKLRFFNLIQGRKPVARAARPVFFMCDEYQNLISANKDGLSDLDFWDKARESRCTGIVSFQGVASVYAALGDRDVADAILQNFRQRIYFRSEDTHTLEQVGAIFGRVEVERESRSESKSSSHGQTSHSESSSRSKTETALIDAQLVRGLAPNEAVAVLSINGRANDDVIRLRPIYLEGTDEEAIEASITPEKLPEPVVSAATAAPAPPAPEHRESENAPPPVVTVNAEDQNGQLPEFSYAELTADLDAAAPAKQTAASKKRPRTKKAAPERTPRRASLRKSPVDLTRQLAGREAATFPAPLTSAKSDPSPPPSTPPKKPSLWLHGIAKATDQQIRAGVIAAQKVLSARAVSAEEALDAWRARRVGEDHNTAAAEAWHDAQEAAIRITWELVGDGSAAPPGAKLGFKEVPASP